MKLLIQIIGVIILWLLGVGWAYVFYGSEFTFQNVESAMLAFVVGFIVFDLVDRVYER